jgi:DNA (cytosine-5)-methyltransferase 1
VYSNIAPKDNQKKPPLTYVSLFSGSGVGCYGFKMNGFECVATNELIERRLNIQRINGKCRYNSGYIRGDITGTEIQQRILDEVKKWKKKEGITGVDVVIATPPCQGISLANHKKTANEIVRNSLVVESIKMIKKIQPKFFILENVKNFLSTPCTDIDGMEKPIKEAIENNLNKYSIFHKVMNFKNYGAKSSRTRTLVIAVRKDFADYISPIDLLPDYKKETTLKKTIGFLESLDTMGQISKTDFYHAFRSYDPRMRNWIQGLGEGQSAFDNEDPSKRPHRIINGEIIQNVNKNGDKYTRQIWNKVAPCVHTRNDQLASQGTVHPIDDRVFSIRELMKMMSVPRSFRWIDKSMKELNALSYAEKIKLYKREEINIRQSLGEAVPTAIFYSIAFKIKKHIEYNRLSLLDIKKKISDDSFMNFEILAAYIENNPEKMDLSTLSKIAELSNALRADKAAYFTNKSIVTKIIQELPTFSDKNVIRILEPSVGVGNFIQPLAKNYSSIPKVIIDVVDIDPTATTIFKILKDKMVIPQNVHINCIQNDFLLHNFSHKYDLVIGNPPFGKPSEIHKDVLSQYKNKAHNTDTDNLFSFFLEKSLSLSDNVALIAPKAVINAPEFKKTRDLLEKRFIRCIIDFGEKGFEDVKIETVSVLVEKPKRRGKTKIVSVPKNTYFEVPQSYICDSSYPYWIIYRNEEFDKVASKLIFDIFAVYRDRQITNANLSSEGFIRVLRSRNISDDGTEIIDINHYDRYLSPLDSVSKLKVMDYKDRDDVYLTPNMTYNPRVIKKPKGVIVNGSVAILIPKDPQLHLTEDEMAYFSTPEYRAFYSIARNHQTRSLNVDNSSVFFFGIKKRG